MPLTQSIDTVKALLKRKGRVTDPLPTFVELENRLVLVLSSRKDVYYIVTAKKCTCPFATFRPGKTCKHQLKYFPKTVEGDKAGKYRPVDEGFDPALDELWKPPKSVFQDEVLGDYDGLAVI